MSHCYDPSCYCVDCCSHEDRLTTKVRAEESARREQLDRERRFHMSSYELRLETVQVR